LKLETTWIGDAHVSDDIPIEERAVSMHCSVNNLIRQHERLRRELFAKTPHGT
jgi:hypothetical protein